MSHDPCLHYSSQLFGSFPFWKACHRVWMGLQVRGVSVCLCLNEKIIHVIECTVCQSNDEDPAYVLILTFIRWSV